MYTNFSRKARVLSGWRKGDIKLQVVNQRDANSTAEMESWRFKRFFNEKLRRLEFSQSPSRSVLPLSEAVP
jgi:hypothetical protein